MSAAPQPAGRLLHCAPAAAPATGGGRAVLTDTEACLKRTALALCCLTSHRHPPFFKIMDEVQQGLRYVFQTKSPYTLCVSGTGHAGMEAAIANLVEPGETVVVGNKGIWGTRVADMADRFGAKVRGGGGSMVEPPSCKSAHALCSDRMGSRVAAAGACTRSVLKLQLGVCWVGGGSQGRGWPRRGLCRPEGGC